MDQEMNKQRIDSIALMIMEMADGNFAYRIPRTGIDDEIEGLTVIVNWMAEDMQESILHAAFVNPHRSYLYVVESTLVIDNNYIVKDFNANASSLLGLNDKELLKVDLRTLLLNESIVLLEGVRNEILQNESFRTILILQFVSAEKLVTTARCSISRLSASSNLQINLFTANVANILEKSLIAKRILTAEEQKINSYLDVKKAQAVYDYILANMDSPIPTLKELSRIFGTNQYKLKNSFRYLFKMTIFQFHNDGRLKRAEFLMLNTKISLKTIAIMLGFPTYPSFSRAFKIKFKYSPNAVDRGGTIT